MSIKWPIFTTMSNSPRTSFPTGIITAVLTPMRSNLQVDPELLVSHCRHLLQSGGDGLVLLGTTGEANSFSVTERQYILEAALDGGLPAKALMAGTGCCAFTDTITLTRHAVDLGLEDVLMLPPFYYKPVSDQALFDTYARIIEEVAHPNLRIYLYHIPQNTGIPLSVQLISKLQARYPLHIAGIKDSGGDWQNTLKLINAFPDLAVYSGSEEYLLDNLLAGGAGCISATANVTLSVAAMTVRAFRDGKDADDLQKTLSALRQVFKGYSFVGALKGFLASSLKNPTWRFLRPPNEELPEETILALRSAFENIVSYELHHT